MIATICITTALIIVSLFTVGHLINLTLEAILIRLISVQEILKDTETSRILREVRDDLNHCNPIPCNEQACKPVKPKGQRPFTRTDVDPTLWRAKFDAMLDDKAKTLKSDNKVFADHHIDRQRFKALATEEQKIRHAELQVLCKAKGREKIAETMGRGAKKKG